MTTNAHTMRTIFDLMGGWVSYIILIHLDDPILRANHVKLINSAEYYYSSIALHRSILASFKFTTTDIYTYTRNADKTTWVASIELELVKAHQSSIKLQSERTHFVVFGLLSP